MGRLRWSFAVIFTTVGLGLMAACSRAPALKPPLQAPAGLEKIQHFVFIMQENRSFDHYFGTYPGADGIPHGTCVPDTDGRPCVAAFHDTNDFNRAGPHDWDNAWGCIDDGKMDGFVRESRHAPVVHVKPSHGDRPAISAEDPLDVMGYHDYHEIPNYWNYAHLYALQDRMFEPVASYSLVAHLYMLAGQSGGFLTPRLDRRTIRWWRGGTPMKFRFPEITEFLAGTKVDWKYYVTSGTVPDNEDGHYIGTPTQQEQHPHRFSHWNPLPRFPKVMDDPEQRARLVDTSEFYKDAQRGALPQVCWVIPSDTVSEHPPNSVSAGMAYVTGLINHVMESPDWESTAIFLCWDDWGGFYDHVVPPKADRFGYGMRVPSLIISPYAKQGYIDHQTHSFCSWLRIVEERYGIAPLTDRDANTDDMLACFDFTQKPRPPVLLAASPQGSPYPQPLQTIEH
jgi:phospholipase C